MTVERKKIWTTMAEITTVIRTAEIRKASLLFKAVFGENSKMKLWLILVSLHAYRLHPYRNMWRDSNENTLHANSN